ncbi:hypothetical protein Apmu_0118_06 [Acidiphilium multivorum AIU301]|nr:hypothetical protein Apmu_0118_06 [Acidiphilium multivorum AIU301]
MAVIFRELRRNPLEARDLRAARQVAGRGAAIDMARRAGAHAAELIMIEDVQALRRGLVRRSGRGKPRGGGRAEAKAEGEKGSPDETGAG